MGSAKNQKNGFLLNLKGQRYFAKFCNIRQNPQDPPKSAKIRQIPPKSARLAGQKSCFGRGVGAIWGSKPWGKQLKPQAFAVGEKALFPRFSRFSKKIVKISIKS